MTERGILMTPENYGKCADGSKTQTRRIVKPSSLAHEWLENAQFTPEFVANSENHLCPFGVVGDRLYVKEGLSREDGTPGIVYRRDKQQVKQLMIGGQYLWEWQKDYLSPLHMPKWAARLWLEITDVRVERLIEINNEDAEAEGCQGREGFDPYEVYAELWDSINGEGSWNTNPWVWAISFKQVSP